MDVIALIGVQRDREHKQFTKIQGRLNERGVAINDWSVGRLYRLFLALVEDSWPQRRERVAATAAKHGGLILMGDGLAPDGAGPQLYVLWEVLSGTPISGMLIDQADEAHLTDWLADCCDLMGDLPVLALLSDKEKALVTALRTAWSEAPHQLCQMHFMKNLSEPVHRADQRLRQTLRARLCLLPAVPELASEETTARIERLVSGPDTPGEKRAH
jgi:hypothetical protein